MKNEEDKGKMLDFLHLAEKLKIELRHNWLSNGRQESVAEHSWRMSLMAILFAPMLKEKINLEKAIRIALVHDLGEAEFGDIPAQENREVEKAQNEYQTLNKIKTVLGSKTGDEIYELWDEYEKQKSPEARFIKALDKLEVRIQHNESDIKTWNDIEFPRSLYVADKYCKYDKFLNDFNELVKEESRKKIEKSDKDLDKIEAQAEALRQEE